MNKIMNWLSTQLNRLRTWWTTNHEQVGKTLSRGYRRTGRFLNRLARNISRILLIGVILNVVYPEFADRFPALYGWFDGWLQFAEFAIKAVFGSISALLAGKFPEFWCEYTNAFQQLFQQFVDWIGSLHF